MTRTTASSVTEFYNDARVFITGGTGFLGKMLIEKLLRVCPNINHIYLLVRVKKGKDPATRLAELFEDPLFKKLHAEKPGFQKKVTCIPGDVNAIRLNISDSDYELLINEVTHVFHSAATVRFNEHIKSAIGINVLGTREIVKLCKKCVHLKIFVHVSTAYSHCVNLRIAEDFYEPPIAADKAISLIETLSEDRLNSITPEIIKPWPNTYTYSKAIAESIIKEEAKSLPTIIVRPGIVMGTYREPVEGWIDNIYGPTGVLVAVGLGLMRVLYADRNCESNIVPVDLTVNAILSCAWDAGNRYNNNALVGNSTPEANCDVGPEKKKDVIPKIYNFVGDKNNALTWRGFLHTTSELGAKYPSEKAIWYYTITLTTLKMFYVPLTYLFHYIPGFLIDVGLLLLGKKPQMVKAYHKIHVFSEATRVFSSKTWDFSDSNIKRVWSLLNEQDKEMFYFDMRGVEWNSYLSGVVQGVRNFLLKESDNSIPYAKRKMFFFWIAHRTLQFSLLGLFIWILSKFMSVFVDLESQLKYPVLMQAGNST